MKINQYSLIRATAIYAITVVACVLLWMTPSARAAGPTGGVVDEQQLSKQAATAMRRGHYDRAVALYEQLVDLQPSEPWYALQLRMATHRVREHDTPRWSRWSEAEVRQAHQTLRQEEREAAQFRKRLSREQKTAARDVEQLLTALERQADADRDERLQREAAASVPDDVGLARVIPQPVAPTVPAPAQQPGPVPVEPEADERPPLLPVQRIRVPSIEELTAIQTDDQRQPVVVHGDEIQFFPEDQRVMARDNVKIERGDMTLTSNQISVLRIPMTLWHKAMSLSINQVKPYAVI